MPRTLLPALLLLVIGFTVSPITAAADGNAAQKYTLRYRFTPGEVLRSKVVQQSQIETTINGSTQTANMSSVSTKVWKVTDVDAKGMITFELLVEDVDMRQQVSGRQEVRYNSQTDEKAPPGYETAADSVGKTLTVNVIDPVGKVLKREKRHQASVDANAQVVTPLPPDEVAVGDTWSVPFEIRVGLEGQQLRTITAKNRYQLDKVEDGIATISVETVLPPVNDPKVRAQLIQRMTRGTIEFDIAAGRVVTQQTTLDEQVIGFNGPNSSLHYVGRFTENLLPDKAAATARK